MSFDAQLLFLWIVTCIRLVSQSHVSLAFDVPVLTGIENPSLLDSVEPSDQSISNVMLLVWLCWFGNNLVDPASSHMLVSKIKPCMFQYKLLYGETANGSLKQL